MSVCGASSFVRLFPVPGMRHCGGGIAAPTAWVEGGGAPDVLADAQAKLKALLQI